MYACDSGNDEIPAGPSLRSPPRFVENVSGLLHLFLDRRALEPWLGCIHARHHVPDICCL